MKIRLIFIVLVLLAASAAAFADVDSECMVACTNELHQQQAYCAVYCDPDVLRETGEGAKDKSYLEQRQQAEDIKLRQMETEKRKMELREQSFQCIAACKELDKTDVYCDAACKPENLD